MVNRVVLNETSYFGRGSREKVNEEVKKRRLKRVLVVTDKTLIDAEVAQMVTNIMDREQAEYWSYCNIKSNPTVENVLEGLEIAKQNDVEGLIAIGGGSVIDTTKAIAVIMTNPEYSDVVSLDGVANTNNKALPIIAIPTTAGTAAEVTINYVITDEKQAKKMVCVDPNDIPVVSIIDPDLMEKMPQNLAATTGMDALTHAMEGYITKAGWLIPDMFHINAMSLIYKNLENAANNKDYYAIEKIAYAQYIAGMGFSNVGLGIVHSMAHSLGAYYDIAHGLANAILLPHVLRFNGSACPDLYRNMGNAFGINVNNISDEEVIERIVAAVQNLSRNLSIPQTLREIGVAEEMLPILAKQAINDACTLGNPRDVTIEDIIEIYKAAY